MNAVASRGRWMAWGLALQVIGVAVPTLVVIERAKTDSTLGQLTRYTVRLAWHEALRSTSDLTLIGLGTAVFVAGSMLLARPFVRRRSTFLFAVPLAAVLGLMAFGVAVLLIAAAIALSESAVDLPLPDVRWWDGPRGRSRRGTDDRGHDD